MHPEANEAASKTEASDSSLTTEAVLLKFGPKNSKLKGNKSEMDCWRDKTNVGKIRKNLAAASEHSDLHDPTHSAELHELMIILPLQSTWPRQLEVDLLTTTACCKASVRVLWRGWHYDLLAEWRAAGRNHCLCRTSVFELNHGATPMVRLSHAESGEGGESQERIP